jgi:hypothetical protein
MEKATHPIVSLAKQFVPEDALSNAVEVAYRASEVFAHKDDILRAARTTQIRDLRNARFEDCDRMASQFARKAGESAMVRGAMISSSGGMGAVVGLEVMVTYSLKCIHTVGFCYGFSPDDFGERECALGILLIAAASNMKEKQRALGELQALEASKIQKDMMNAMRDSAVETLTEESTEVLAEEAIERVSQTTIEEVITERAIESTALSAIPFLGILLGGVSDAAVAQYVGETAKRVFQERWLRANQRVTTIAADPKQSRSRFRRAEGVVAAGVYWTTFAASFVVSWPIAMAASFVPRNGPVARGCVHGGRQATHDGKALAAQLRNQFVPQRKPEASDELAIQSS